MTTMTVHDVSIFVKVIGNGYPLVLMHGGLGVDHTTMLPLRPLSHRHKLILYDHRCNGRSADVDVTTLTWENLTADADALRQKLGYEKWAVLGHSFGGMIALEYALRYPGRLSHLILLDTCGESRWVQENASVLLAERGYSSELVKNASRFYKGQIEPDEVMPIIRKLGSAYYHHLNLIQLARQVVMGIRMKVRPEALIHGYGQLLKGWSVMDRLGGIQVPTLVMAGREDFQFPPEHQVQLEAGIPNAHLKIIERAGHNAHSERPGEVIEAIEDFMAIS